MTIALFYLNTFLEPITLPFTHQLKRQIRAISILIVSVFAVFLSANTAADTNMPRTQSDLVVVVSAKNEISSLSKNDVIDIYMGRFNTFPNGTEAKPLDFPDGSQEKKDFYQKLVGKDERKIKSYWSRLLFSGRAQPPRVIESEQSLINLLNENDTIAYIPASDVTSEMKIVYQL